MRLRVTLDAPRPVTVPIDHYHLMRGVAYRLLGLGNPDLARFLHDDGYAATGYPTPKLDGRRYKLFTFSLLRVAPHRRRLAGGNLHITPGPVEWLIGSPREDFLRAHLDGLLGGTDFTLGGNRLYLREIEALPAPAFTSAIRFSCLTPIVASVPSPDRDTPYYLRPRDSDAFSAAVRQNLLHKYAALHAAPPPAGDALTLTFDPAYLSRHPHGGTKKATLGPIEVVGVQSPLTLTGSPALIETAYECGLGQLNASGFGMISPL